MPQPKSEQPVFLIVAGPNGSGKSSVYRDADLEWDGRSVWIVNPDLLAARIRDVEAVPLEEANLAAVIRIEAWLDASIGVHKTIGVETVLSTDKYRRLVDKAKTLGFAIWMIYVVLYSPERSIERIKLRVAKGGHAVSDDAVRKRYGKSLEQFRWFADQVDQAWIYNNSGASTKRIGGKDGRGDYPGRGRTPGHYRRSPGDRDRLKWFPRSLAGRGGSCDRALEKLSAICRQSPG